MSDIWDKINGAVEGGIHTTFTPSAGDIDEKGGNGLEIIIEGATLAQLPMEDNGVDGRAESTVNVDRGAN